MKKYLLLFAVAIMGIACTSVEEKAIDKCKEILKEYDAGNFGKADELSKEFRKWYVSLDAEDQAKADRALEPYAMRIVTMNLDMYGQDGFGNTIEDYYDAYDYYY